MLSTFRPKSEKVVLTRTGSRTGEARGSRPPVSTLPPLGRTAPSPRSNVVGAYGKKWSERSRKNVLQDVSPAPCSQPVPSQELLFQQ